MKRTKRSLAMLLILCTLVSMLASTPVTAAAPSQMTVAELAAASGDVQAKINAVILSGTQDSNGVYADIVAPTAIAVGSYDMGIEDYTLMAAQAIVAISEGKDSSTQIAYTDVALTERTAIGDAVTGINAGQILNLAVRVTNYGISMGELATSHNRPTDGTNVLEGRLCVYTIAEAFAATLASYASSGALATSVTITPSSYTTGDTTDPEESTTPSEPATPSESTAPSESTTPSETAGDWYPDVIAAGAAVEAYVLANEDLPTSVTIMGQEVTMAQFLYLAAQAVVNINSGTTSGELKLISVSEPPNPTDSITAGNIELAEYVELAGRIITFIEENGRPGNYMSTSLGDLHYKEGVYMMAKALEFYGTEGRLPNYCGVTLWAITSGNFVEGDAAFGADYSAYAAYLVPTANCQSTNATIISVAKTGMNYNGGKSWGSTPTNTYQAMWNLFEYLNDKTYYCDPMYFNTVKGALGTWNSKVGNCCDMAHLFNACARSLGVPARYRHAYCHFATFSTGHVWAEPYCGSSYGWMTADLVSSYNYLGYKTNTTSYYKSADKVASLPF